MAADDPEEKKTFLAGLGGRIRDLRTARNLTQEQLGFASGRDQHYLSQVEQGERNVSVMTARAIARGLGVSLAEMFDSL